MSVAIIMGSKSDLEIVRGAFDTLKEFDVPFTARVLSAHRTPRETAQFVSEAEANGIKVFICAAGMAAHLAGVVAAETTLPVIGIPIPSKPFEAMDSLLAMVQMPPGIPVATVTAGKAGAKNAALLAVEMLSLSDNRLKEALKQYRIKQRDQVLAADAELQAELGK